ncbi:hypothetical protein V6N12_002704 [Hibiscus sabdariffa]|uniref:Uncharacterized protein n=1 Tax=Hibiscus sabdariffa TaxID=183260 RepID=A0ABR2E9R4_9ROSI
MHNPMQHQLHNIPPPPGPCHLPTHLLRLVTLKNFTSRPTTRMMYSIGSHPETTFNQSARLHPNQPWQYPFLDQLQHQPAQKRRRRHIITSDSDDENSVAIPDISADPSLSFSF